MKTANILTIAGSDSGGGAGIQADIKTITTLGGYATSAITCVTVQNTMGVFDIEVIEQKIVQKQIECVLKDIQIDTIKIGLIPNIETVKIIAETLSQLNIWTVLDPVFISTSGYKLNQEPTHKALLKYLVPYCNLLTPNISEAETLANIKIKSTEDMKIACNIISSKNPINILLKGGHCIGPMCNDLLFLYKENKFIEFRNLKIRSSNTHGTGCSMSSAIAYYKAKKIPLTSSIEKSIHYVRAALLNGKDLNIGHGNGPIWH